MDNGRSSFVVFVFGDPHLLKGGQRSKDGTTDPDGVFTLRGGNNFDFHGGGGKGHNFFGQTFGNAFKHGGTAGQDNVGVQIFTDVDVTFHDGGKQSIVDTGGFLSNEGRLKQDFRATETFVANGCRPAIRMIFQFPKIPWPISFRRQSPKRRSTIFL